MIDGGKNLVVDGIHRHLLSLLPGFLCGGIKRDVDLALGNAEVGQILIGVGERHHHVLGKVLCDLLTA